MHFFVSYAREDREVAGEVVDGARRLGHDVWIDNALTGGQAWWDTILAEIERCDGFLLIVSEASLESQACGRELAYARALAKTVIPVATTALEPQLLPPDLAVLQFVDFSSQNRESAFQLAVTLSRVQPAPPLPDPLPEPPPVPVSYMSELTQRVNAPTLTLDEQFALLARLRGAMERPREREAAVELLERLRARDDLFHAVARDMNAILREDTPAAEPAPAAIAPMAAPNRAPVAPRPRPVATPVATPVPGSGANGSWRVDVREKGDRVRRITVVRRQAHELAYTVNPMPGGAVLSMDQMRFQDKRVTSWATCHKEFKILDGGELVPVDVRIRLDYRGAIKSVVLKVGGAVVYQD